MYGFHVEIGVRKANVKWYEDSQTGSLGKFNVLALGAVADFGAQNCQYTTKVDAR
jgi:hypothetical protein